MEREDSLFKVFYTKDINKKKNKRYEDGWLVITHKATLYNDVGVSVYSAKGTPLLEVDEEYTLNNKYLIYIDKRLPFKEYTSGRVFQLQLPPPPVHVSKPRGPSLERIQVEIGHEGEGGLLIDKALSDKLFPYQV